MALRAIPAYRVIAKFVREVQHLPPDEALDALELKAQHYVRGLLTALPPSFAELGQRSTVTQLGDPDLGALSRALDDLEACSLKTLAEEALATGAQALPRPDLEARIVLLPGDGESRVLVSQMHGVLGFSLGDQATMAFVWPVPGWQEWLTYTLTHEYAHLVRNHLFPRAVSGGRLIYQKTDEAETLLDAMVAEGIADSFARDLYPHCAPAWTDALPGEREQRVWRKVRRRLQVGDPSEIRRVLFGDNDRIPQWTGYTMGYRITQRYLRAHPQVRAGQLVGLAAKAIFQGSGYAEALEV